MCGIKTFLVALWNTNRDKLRAIINWASKVIWDRFGFALPFSVFFSRKLVPLSQSIRCKTNTIHELVDGAFKALSILLVFTSCSYRLLRTFFFMIDRFDNFDFVFTKFNQNARYVIMRVSLLFRSFIFRAMRKIASSKQTKEFRKCSEIILRIISTYWIIHWCITNSKQFSLLHQTPSASYGMFTKQFYYNCRRTNHSLYGYVCFRHWIHKWGKHGESEVRLTSTFPMF